MPPAPTRIQLATLQWLADFTRSMGYAPTYRDASKMLGISRPTMFGRVAALRIRGLVVTMQQERRFNCLAVTDAGMKLVKPPVCTLPLGRVGWGGITWPRRTLPSYRLHHRRMWQLRRYAPDLYAECVGAQLAKFTERLARVA